MCATAVGLAVRTGIHLLAHAAIPLAEEAAQAFDPTAVVAAIVTTTLVTILLVGPRLKSRRQLWLLVALFGVGALSVVVFAGAVIAFRMMGLA